MLTGPYFKYKTYSDLFNHPYWKKAAYMDLLTKKIRMIFTLIVFYLVSSWLFPLSVSN